MDQTITSSELNLKMPRVETISLSGSQEKVEQLYVDEQWVNSHTGGTFKVCNPAPEELTTKLFDVGPMGIKQTIVLGISCTIIGQSYIFLWIIFWLRSLFSLVLVP